MKSETLVALLREAFPPLPIDATNAFESRGIAYSDATEYRTRLDGKNWTDLEPEFFSRRSDALSFLGDNHLIFVLPHYLRLLLELECFSPVPESLLPVLTKPLPTDVPATLFDWRTERFQGLTHLLSDSQKHAVAAVLRHFIATSTPRLGGLAQRAIERYWRLFA